MFSNTTNKIRVLLLALVLAVSFPAFAEEEAMDISFDNLSRIKDARVAMAYIDPEADFSVFQRVAILDPMVAFRANWQRDQNRGTRTRRVRAADMERIKTSVADLFKEVFIEVLEADDGYEIVDVTGDDVIVLRPAIIDLDITAPDAMSSGRNRTWTATTGAATLYLELFDSVSGKIIGRAADRRSARRAGGMMTVSNRVTNTVEARRMFRSWAEKFRDFLDTHYKPGQAVTVGD